MTPNPGRPKMPPVAVLAVSLCALAPAPPADSRGGASPGGVSAERISWRACGRQLECARVPVPLDWARPNGCKISLAVIRHYGHMSNPDPSACVDPALSRYVVDLVTPSRGTVCRSDRQ